MVAWRWVALSRTMRPYSVVLCALIMLLHPQVFPSIPRPLAPLLDTLIIFTIVYVVVGVSTPRQARPLPPLPAHVPWWNGKLMVFEWHVAQVSFLSHLTSTDYLSLLLFSLPSLLLIYHRSMMVAIKAVG